MLWRAAEEFIFRARELVDVAAITAPPINPERLARLRGIQRVVLSNALQVSGRIVRDRDGLVIELNAKERLERRNFSCCHEIAHTFVLDQSVQKNRVTSEVVACSGASAEEYWCDRAAAEMLMPEKLFRPLAANLYPSIDSIVELSRSFVASLGATIVRVGQFGVWPVVFIGWKFTNRVGSFPKLRVVWSVKPAGYRCFVPRHAPVDPASGIHATFLSSQPTCDTEKLDLGSLRGKYLIENRRFGDYVVSIVHDPKLLGRA